MLLKVSCSMVLEVSTYKNLDGDMPSKILFLTKL